MKKLSGIFKSRSGVSLLMVIGTMALLFAISASIFAAAYANIGYNARQNEANRIRLISESVHRNIKFALENEPDSVMSLSNQLIMRLFNAADSDTPVPVSDIHLRINIDGDLYLPEDEYINFNGITLSWSHEDVKIIDSISYVPGINDPDDPDPALAGTYDPASPFVTVPAVHRKPKTAEINATLTVTVEVEAERLFAHLGRRNRVITTIVTYEYTGGFLSEEKSVNPEYNPILNLDYEMLFENYGTWSLISYDTIDSIQSD